MKSGQHFKLSAFFMEWLMSDLSANNLIPMTGKLRAANNRLNVISLALTNWLFWRACALN